MLARSLVVPALLLATFTFTSAQSAFPDRCPGNQPLPFAGIQVRHPIDGSCGMQGGASSPDATRLQNSVKNNFCGVAPDGKPETFTPQMLIELQKNTHAATGSGKEPADRKELQRLGEGKVIRMKASLIEAHFADLGAGERVNCNQPKEEDNDIHIAFGDRPDAPECESVTGEISPHFRPDSWSQIGNFQKLDGTTKRNVHNPGVAARLQAQPLRITGQLFFDSSHSPCPCGTQCNPVRASDWEIHPIYNIEVCKAGSPCDVNADADWIAFDAWWNSGAQPRPTNAAPAPDGQEKKKASKGTTP
jgi:hypothetical protein